MSDEYTRCKELLDQADTILLSVVNDRNFPQIYPMEKVSNMDLEQVLIITKRDSYKVSCLNKNNQCCIATYREDTVVSLEGKMEIIKSISQMTELLNEEYYKRLRNSGMERYCILLFQTTKVTYMKSGKKLEVEMNRKM